MTRPLFPVAPLLASGYLPEQDGHEIYFETRGTAGGTPLLYLHGGPGSGCSPNITRLLDGDRNYIVLMDQRGAGQSRPHGSLSHNTTQHLIADIERLRTHLGITQWRVFGGSWGATLAVAYAMAHPGHVSEMVLYGLFLARQRELERLYYPGGVAASLFPEVFDDFIAPVPESLRDDPIKAYAALFNAPDPHTRSAALLCWTRLEKAVSRLILDYDALDAELSDPDYVLAHSLIENHYFQRHGFINGDAILHDASARLRSIPITLIASRYDIVCPMETAMEFVRAAPHARLQIVADAGHTWRDPANTQALLDALNATGTDTDTP